MVDADVEVPGSPNSDAIPPGQPSPPVPTMPKAESEGLTLTERQQAARFLGPGIIERAETDSMLRETVRSRIAAAVVEDDPRLRGTAQAAPVSPGGASHSSGGHQEGGSVKAEQISSESGDERPLLPSGAGCRPTMPFNHRARSRSRER